MLCQDDFGESSNNKSCFCYLIEIIFIDSKKEQPHAYESKYQKLDSNEAKNGATRSAENLITLGESTEKLHASNEQKQALIE